MNFFKSILSDEPDPPNRDPDPKTDEGSTPTNKIDDDAGNLWSFGGLMKTLANQSESMLDTYRKDLREFGSGLKKETEILSRAVKELPVSLEAAQGAIDGVIKSTAEIISKEASIFISDGESSETVEINRGVSSSGRYSWYESQLSAIQSDASSFTEDPEDTEEFKKWKSGFELGEAFRAEIEVLIAENGALEGLYERIVPDKVDEVTFWCRYFFRVDRLKQQERMREKLMKRVSVDDDDEELSWDVDDDDSSDDDKVENKKEKDNGEKEKGDMKLDDAGSSSVVEKGEVSSVVEKQEVSSVEKQEDSIFEPHGVKDDDKEKENAAELGESVKRSEDLDKSKPQVEEVAEVKSEEKLKPKGNVEEKSNDEVDTHEKRENDQKHEVVSLSKEEDEEDMGWDEIEDVESGDEKKTSDAAVTTKSGSSNREELRKRLSVADNDAEDEDLNWDIEDEDDDDVPAKA